LRKDERLRTVYETIAPHITRTEGAWRDYLGFAARLYKYSFDNALLVYAQTSPCLPPHQYGTNLADTSIKARQDWRSASMTMPG